MSAPSQQELALAIARAASSALAGLFDRAERFYYCALITTGEALPPFLSAWSEEALERATGASPVPVAAARALKWSYADSPYCAFGLHHFAPLKALFDARPQMNPVAPGWASEWQFRVDAMEAAMARLDADGLFGRGKDRSRIVINVEVAPPDRSNTERAIRLNPPEALTAWLAEAAEP